MCLTFISMLLAGQGCNPKQHFAVITYQLSRGAMDRLMRSSSRVESDVFVCNMQFMKKREEIIDQEVKRTGPLL